MANNTPAAVIPRQFRSAPMVPRGSSSGARAGGGGRGSGNPLGQAYQGGEGDVDEPYIPSSGHLIGDLIAHGMNTDIASRNEAKHHEASAAQQEKVQAGVDAYGQALKQTGDPRQALASVFGADNEGHVHFTEPATFNAILQLAQAHIGAQQGGAGSGQFQSVDLGHGLVGVMDPTGKASVHNAKDLAGGAGSKMVKGPGGQFGQFDPNSNNFTPATVGGQPQQGAQPKQQLTSKAQLDQLSDMQTVLSNVQKMRNTVGATGSLGYGTINRHIAENTGFGGPQGEAYNAAYNEMAPALVRLSRVPGQSKLVAELALDKLPKPGQAYGFNVDQALPNIEYEMRRQVANLYQTYKLENRPGGRELAKQIGQQYDAHPDQIADITAAKEALRAQPGQMTNDQVATLNHEMQAGRLPYDDWTRTMRQMIQRGMIDPQNFDKAVAANPNLTQLSPEEHVAPQYLRAFQPPQQPAPAQIPGGQQQSPQAQPTQGPQQGQPPMGNSPGAQNVPAAPPGPAQASAPPAAPQAQAAAPLPPAQAQGGPPQAPVDAAEQERQAESMRLLFNSPNTPPSQQGF